MYKAIDGKMIMGPIWDMDWSSGAGGTSAGATNQWATNYFSQDAQANQWYKYLVKDPYFLMKLQERYWEIRDVQIQDMLDSMEEYYEQIKESGQADSNLWHSGGWNSVSFDSDYNSLKTWLNTHVAWIDQQMTTEDSFDSAFLSKSSNLVLSITDTEGNSLMDDYAEKAPADAFAGKSTDLLLHISGIATGTAEIYINSKLIDTVTLNGQKTTFAIAASALTEEIETKNVIEVKVKNNSGNVSASNYITVRQSTCDHSFAEKWSKNDTQHWKECQECKLQLGLADHTFEWVIDKEATENENGIRHEACTVCGYARTKEEYEYIELPADPSDDSKDVSTDLMTAISGSEQSGNEDDNILDGNASTIWHTQHGMIHTLEERWCGVKLEEAVMVSGIRCLPRTDGGNGTVTEYSVQYRTSDNGEWIEAATGTWDSTDLSWKMVTFTPVMAKQVRIVGIHSFYNGNTQDKHMSMAEFRLISGGSAGSAVEADKTALNAMIENAKGLKEEDYTLESWEAANLEEIIAHAEKIAADKDADQETVDAETAKLEAAIEKLEEKTETPIDPAEDKVVRLSGTDRYATGFAVADKLKEVLGVEKFDTVVIATGKGYADALSGSYLAAVKNAPILLTNGKTANVAELHAYIKENVKAGATIYVLGGEAAVSKEAATIEGYDTTRLSGTNRYETNLAILAEAEAGAEGDDLLVATGKDFADSLSASAAARPILLVKPDTALTDVQKAVAENFKNIYVIGGTGAVSEAIAEELTAYGNVTRLSGSNRYETSVKVAETFFENPETVLLASGKNFPDGLCGGALAAALKASLLLTKAGAENTAAEYVVSNDIASGYVLGGEGAVSNDTVVTVFGQDSFSNGSNEIISVADARRNEFYHNITEFKTTGTVYYISNSGNDNNDGLSPETAWATLDRAFETYWPLTRDFLKPGDTVLLERGGTWYISSDEIEGLTSDAYNVVDGVTLGAYGEGARPIIRGDIPEANNPAFWEQYYDENGVKIWASVEPLQDSNVIVFNDGERYAEEVMPYWSIALNNYCNIEGEAFDIEAALENDLSFCCMLNLDSAESMDLKNSTAKGTLYLRCDKGNPAEVFEKIAVPQAQTGLVLHTDATLIDLDIRYFTCIAAELSGYDGHSGQQVSNCEVSWCGGLISEYQTFDSEVVGLLSPYCSGGALQVSGSENSVRDCYIHHCGPMTLICSIHVDEPGVCKLESMTYTGNLIEYCGSALHIADLSKMDDDNAEGYISNLTFSDNIVMYSGESWIKNHILRISDEHSAFFSAVENAMGASNNDGIYITNNIFYGSCASLLYITDNLWNDTGKVNQSMSFSSNVYAQYKDGILCNFNWERGYRVGCALDEQEFLAFIGDTTGTVVTIQ